VAATKKDSDKAKAKVKNKKTPNKKNVPEV
jgi:hypothetical protein